MAVEIKELLIRAFVGGLQDDIEEVDTADDADEKEHADRTYQTKDTINVFTDMLKQSKER
jgi:hypothetical protein